jgi:hypothetical protein
MSEPVVIVNMATGGVMCTTRSDARCNNRDYLVIPIGPIAPTHTLLPNRLRCIDGSEVAMAMLRVIAESKQSDRSFKKRRTE